MKKSALALISLRELLKNSNARFKSSEQAKAVRCILRRKKDCLVILPTGGGKSLMFQLPVYMEKTLTTVVVIPFVALLEEMLEKCQELGLNCQEWKKVKREEMEISSEYQVQRYNDL